MDVEYINLGKCSKWTSRSDEYYKNKGDTYDITFSTGKTLRENLASLFGYTGDSYKIPVTTSNNVDTGFKIEFYHIHDRDRDSYQYYSDTSFKIYNNTGIYTDLDTINIFGTVRPSYSLSSSDYYSYINTSNTYYLDYIRSTDIIALGIRGDNRSSVNLPIIFVKNENNNWTFLSTLQQILYSFSSSYISKASCTSNSNKTTYTNPLIGFKANDKSTKTYFTINRNNTSGVATSFVQMPDIYDSCLFNNLYIVLSGVITSGSLVNVNGSEYKILGDPYCACGNTCLATKLY